MKYILTTLFLLFVLLTYGQQAEETLKIKPAKEFKRFSFELEYTPLSDIQPVFLFKTNKDNCLGMKILSSSALFLFSENTNDLFGEKNFWSFQTTMFISFRFSTMFEYSYSYHNDIFNLFYRKYFNRKMLNYIDFGLFYNYGNPKASSFAIHHIGFETSYSYRITNNISLGCSVQVGPHISMSIDDIFYSGFAISASYLVINFKIL